MLIHFDIVDSGFSNAAELGSKRLDALLMNLCILGSVFDPVAGLRWAWSAQDTGLCIEVPAPSMLDQLSSLAVLPRRQVVARGHSFCGTEEELQAVLCGSGSSMNTFVAARSAGGGESQVNQTSPFDGMWKEGCIQGNTFTGKDGTVGKIEFDDANPSRVYLTIVAKRYIGELRADGICWDDGDVWHRIEDADTSAAIKTMERDECTTRKLAPSEVANVKHVQAVCNAICEPTAVLRGMQGKDMAGSQCFEALLNAVQHRLGNREPSLTALLSFVRVVSWQLQELTDPGCPFNTFFADAPGGQYSRVKSLRGEMFSFLCRTALDFTCRQERKAPQERRDEWLRLIHEVSIGGASMGQTSEWLQRAPFTSNGQSVFRAGTFLNPTYVHFRVSDNTAKCKWVQEASVRQDGDVFYQSEEKGYISRKQAATEELKVDAAVWLSKTEGKQIESTRAQLYSHSDGVQEFSELAEKDEERAMTAG
jgi:hypothetical protein